MVFMHDRRCFVQRVDAHVTGVILFAHTDPFCLCYREWLLQLIPVPSDGVT